MTERLNDIVIIEAARKCIEADGNNDKSFYVNACLLKERYEVIYCKATGEKLKKDLKNDIKALTEQISLINMNRELYLKAGYLKGNEAPQ